MPAGRHGGPLGCGPWGWGGPRNPGQYQRLLQRLGFQDVQAACAAGLLHVVLGTRAPP